MIAAAKDVGLRFAAYAASAKSTECDLLNMARNATAAAFDASSRRVWLLEASSTTFNFLHSDILQAYFCALANSLAAYAAKAKSAYRDSERPWTSQSLLMSEAWNRVLYHRGRAC